MAIEQAYIDFPWFDITPVPIQNEHVVCYGFENQDGSFVCIECGKMSNAR